MEKSKIKHTLRDVIIGRIVYSVRYAENFNSISAFIDSYIIEEVIDWLFRIDVIKDHPDIKTYAQLTKHPELLHYFPSMRWIERRVNKAIKNDLSISAYPSWYKYKVVHRISDEAIARIETRSELLVGNKIIYIGGDVNADYATEMVKYAAHFCVEGESYEVSAIYNPSAKEEAIKIKIDGKENPYYMHVSSFSKNKSVPKAWNLLYMKGCMVEKAVSICKEDKRSKMYVEKR